MTNIELDTLRAVNHAARKYTEIDWEQRRYEIAKDVLIGTWQICREDEYRSNYALKYNAIEQAVRIADLLIEELKKKH